MNSDSINWEELRLDEIFHISRGGSPRPIKDFITDSEEGLNWVKIGDTKGIDKYIYSTKQKIRKGGLKKSVWVKEDDFILSNSMSYGKPYIMKTNGCIHDGWLLMRRKSQNLSIDYMYYLLSSDVIKNQFKSKAAGSTVQNLNIKLVSTVKALVPSFKEQQKIAEILSTVDAKIEVIVQQIRETQELKKGLMQRLLTKGIGHTEFKDSPLGNIPKSWEVKIMSELTDEVTDYVAAGSFASLRENVNVFSKPNHAIYVRLTDLRKGLGHGEQKYVDKDSYTFLSKSNLFGREILFANIGANVGEVWMMPVIEKEATVAPNMIVIRANNENVVPEYLHAYLCSSIGLRQIDKIIAGSGHPKINKTELRRLSAILPPLPEQKQIADILNSVDEKIEVLTEKKTTYKELKKGLMQKLLTGKVRVKLNTSVSA